MDQINLSHSVEEVANQDREQQFLLLRNFISVEFAQWLLRTSSDVPVRKVICGDKRMRFGEQDFTEGYPQMFTSTCPGE